MTCGWGAELAAIAAEEGFEYLDAQIKRVGPYDVPIPSNPQME